MPWPPTRFERHEETLRTSTRACRVVTDEGKAYLKALGNPQGPHVLACELVGTALASWFGLQTLPWATIVLTAEDRIPLLDGRNAQAGPAFVTAAENGAPWGGNLEELQGIHNPADIARLVVFDTWLRNCDRYPPAGAGRKPNPDNVFISWGRPSRPCLVAIDHGHCFTCGRDLNTQIGDIERVRDARIYGLFPEFRAFMTPANVGPAIQDLTTCGPDIVRPFVVAIPPEWEVPDAVREAIVAFTVERTQFVAQNFELWLAQG